MKRFPGLERRTATDEEREEIKRVSGDPNHANLPASVSLLRADEVEEIMAGNGAKYKVGFKSTILLKITIFV